MNEMPKALTDYCDCREDAGQHYYDDKVACQQVRRAVIKKEYVELEMLIKKITGWGTHRFGGCDRDNHMAKTLERVCEHGDVIAVATMLLFGVRFSHVSSEVFYMALDNNNVELMRVFMAHQPNTTDILDNVIVRNRINSYGARFLKLYTKDTPARRMLKLLYRLRTGIDIDTVDTVHDTQDHDYTEKFDTNERITDEENKELNPMHYYSCINQHAHMNSAEHINADVVRWLLRMNADVDTKDRNGCTALMNICRTNSHIDNHTALLDAKADVNAKDDSGRTALMTAAAKPYFQVIDKLIEAKADVNAKDNNGETALMTAANSTHTETIDKLLEAKADVNAENRDGDTAMCMLRMRTWPSSATQQIQRLLDCKANINAGGTSTVLINAIRDLSSQQTIKYILDAKADVNTTTRYDMTALKTLANAMRRSHSSTITTFYIDRMKILLEAKADASTLDAQSKNVLLTECIQYDGDATPLRMLLDAVK